MKLHSLLIALSAALALGATAAGASDAPADADRLALLKAHAAEPVGHVRFLRPIHSYEVVDQHALLVWETPFKAWLVELRDSPACKYLDREFSASFETFSDTLNTRNGYVTAPHGVRCKMETIREVDVPAWRQARRTAGLAK